MSHTDPWKNSTLVKLFEDEKALFESRKDTSEPTEAKSVLEEAILSSNPEAMKWKDTFEDLLFLSRFLILLQSKCLDLPSAFPSALGRAVSDALRAPRNEPIDRIMKDVNNAPYEYFKALYKDVNQRKLYEYATSEDTLAFKHAVVLAAYWKNNISIRSKYMTIMENKKKLEGEGTYESEILEYLEKAKKEASDLVVKCRPYNHALKSLASMGATLNADSIGSKLHSMLLELDVDQCGTFWKNFVDAETDYDKISQLTIAWLVKVRLLIFSPAPSIHQPLGKRERSEEPEPKKEQKKVRV